MQMKCNVDGLASAAGQAAIDGDACYGAMYAHSLDELARNLKELRDRYQRGDTAVVDEFFKLYVFSDQNN